MRMKDICREFLVPRAIFSTSLLVFPELPHRAHRPIPGVFASDSGLDPGTQSASVPRLPHRIPICLSQEVFALFWTLILDPVC